MFKLICILIVLTSSTIAISQTQKEVDSVSYALYQKQNWSTLVKYSGQMINRGIDFHLLRMRAGISEFELRDYISAIPHFRKALEFNPNDNVALEYLYFSELLSGNSIAADIISEKLPESRIRELGLDKKFLLSNIYAESGYTTNINLSDLQNTSFSEPLIYDEEKFIRDQSYFNMSIGLKPLPYLRFGVAYSKNIINTITRISELIDSSRSFDNKTDLNELYLNAAIYIGHGFTITSAYHYLSGEAEYTNFRYIIGNQGIEPEYTTLSADIKDHVFSIAVNKFAGKYNLDLSGSVSDLNNSTTYQTKFVTTFFPLGNLDLYFASGVTYLYDKSSDKSNRIIFEPKLGAKIIDELWGEIYYTIGNISNYNEGNAYIVYNNPEKIENRLGVNFISPLIPGKLNLSLRLQMYDQYSYSLRYTDFTNFILSDNKNKLIKLIGGIQWTI